MGNSAIPATQSMLLGCGHNADPLLLPDSAWVLLITLKGKNSNNETANTDGAVATP